MNHIVRMLLLAGVALTLSACATTNPHKPVSSDISFAPAIDVSYGEVVKNVPEYLGTNVRWGGQIIAAEDVGDKTRLTVLAYPLDKVGRPNGQADPNFNGGRFIIETYNFDESEGGRFITVYGLISDKEVLTNGKLQKEIPVVSAIDTMEWESTTAGHYRHRGRYLPYHGLSLGLGFGRGGLGFSSIGYNYYGYGPFGRVGVNLGSFLYPSRYYYGRSRYRSRRYR